jgi:hypothetical protein
MKVYSVMRHVQYEGEDLLGVFGSREDAEKYVSRQEDKKDYYDFGIVESELGQEIDFHRMVDWVR